MQQEQVAETQEQQEEKLFTATCYANNINLDAWLVDNGCTHHMTSKINIFKTLYSSYTLRVKVDHEEFVNIKGKDEVAMKTLTGIIKCSICATNKSKHEKCYLDG